MKKKFYFPVLFAALFVFAAQVSSASAQSSAGGILKQATRILGDERSLRNLKSFQKKGTITRAKDGASGAILIEGAAPNFYKVEFDLNGFESASGFNGKSGWTRDSRSGLRSLTGEASRDFQTEAAFRNRLWLDYKREKAKITSAGQENVGGKTANVLLYATAKGGLIKLYFDAANGMLLREESSTDGTARTIDYADYRKIDGISEPFSIKEKLGEDVYEIKLDEVKHNASIAAAEFDFPKISGAPLPDIPALLASLQANEDKIEEILDTYSYAQKITSRALGKDGVLRETESETAQVSFYKGNRIRRIIEKNDKPLSEFEQADEDKNVQKRVAEIDKQLARKEAKTAVRKDGAPVEDEDADKRISIAELLRASNLVNPRRETFRGRAVIVFDFEPNPNFDYKNAKSFLKFFGKTAGVMWIDAEDKQVARLEAVLADNFKIGGGVVANLKKGASFVLEQERINDEIWLPSSADINLSVKVLLIKGISVNQIVKTYDYRKVSTEVKDAKIDKR